MRKRNFKLFVCFFAIIVSILSSSSVRAEGKISIEPDGTPGVGGQDDCKPWSYVCIVNLAAFRISYYENGTTLKGALDVYDASGYTDDAMKMIAGFPGNNNEGKIDVHRISTNREDRYLCRGGDACQANAGSDSFYLNIDLNTNLGFTNFSSKSAQAKYYKKVWKNFGNDVDLISNILGQMNLSPDDITAALKNKKNRLMIEPLYRVKVQEPNDVLKALKTGKSNWKYVVGTAYNISKFLITNESYGKGNQSNINGTLCSTNDNGNNLEKIYCSRKEKAHVSRIANSLRISEKIKVGSVTFKAPAAAVQNKTEMRDVAKQNSGYGVAVIKFNYKVDNPEPEGESKSVCYKKIGDCSENTNMVSIITDVDEDSVSEDQNQCKTSDEYTSSKYGIETASINDYCSLYCKENKSYTIPTGLKNSGFGLLTEGTSNFYSNRFSIEAEETMTCKIDFKYYYGDNEVATNAVNKVFGERATVTIAEKDLAVAYSEYNTFKITHGLKSETCKTEANSNGCVVDGVAQDTESCKKRGHGSLNLDNCGDYYWNYLYTLKTIKDKYIECSKRTFDENDFTSNLQSPIVSSNEGTLSMKEEMANATLEGADFQQEMNRISDKTCGEAGCFELLCNNQDKGRVWGNDQTLMGENKLSGPCQLVAHFQPTLLAKPAMTLTAKKIYEIENTIQYNKNGTNNEEGSGNYTKPSGSAVVYPGVCPNTSKVSNKSESSQTELKVTIADNAIEKYCNNSKGSFEISIEHSSKSYACPCPPETKNSGTNAYLWVSRKEELTDSLIQEFENGLKCSEAIKKVCNLNKPSDSGNGYEQILGEDEQTVIDGCLSSGVPYKICYTNVDRKASCKDGADITNQVWEYIANDIGNFTNDTTITNEIWKNAAEVVSKSMKACPCDNPDDPNEPDFVYRTVGLGNKQLSFPGIDGNGRKIGSNWSEIDIQTILINHKNIYSGEPMYTIVLDPATIRKIRTYNRNSNKNYGEYLNMKCNKDGSACISSFLNDNDYDVRGKCASVNNSKESFYGASCVNYNSYGS